MAGGDAFAVVEIGDGAGNAEDFVVGPGGEAQVVDAVFEQVLAIFGQFAERADLPGRHLRVIPGAAAGESLGLDGPGGDDEAPHVCTAGAPPVGREFLEGDGGDFDVDVDPVEERARNFAHVAFDLRRAAVAVPPRIVPIAAGARIEGGDEHEVGGERGAVEGAGNGHRGILERLAEDFQRAAVELGKLVEEEHAVSFYHGDKGKIVL